MVSSGRLGLGHGVDEGDQLVVGREREAVGVHLAQLGQALVPQLGVPGVVVAVGAEAQLHVELGHGGHPAAEHLEQAHLDPLVVADPAGRLLHAEDARAAPGGPTARRAPAASSDQPTLDPPVCAENGRYRGTASRALTLRSSHSGGDLAKDDGDEDEAGAGELDGGEGVAGDGGERAPRTPVRRGAARPPAPAGPSAGRSPGARRRARWRRARWRRRRPGRRRGSRSRRARSPGSAQPAPTTVTCTAARRMGSCRWAVSPRITTWPAKAIAQPEGEQLALAEAARCPAAARVGEEDEADHRDGDAGEGHRVGSPAEEDEPEERHEHDQEVGDERRGGRARVLEADGLQHVAEQQGDPGHGAVAHARAGLAGRRRAIEPQDGGGDEEADGEERDRLHPLDRALHGDERAPEADRRDHEGEVAAAFVEQSGARPTVWRRSCASVQSTATLSSKGVPEAGDRARSRPRRRRRVRRAPTSRRSPTEPARAGSRGGGRRRSRPRVDPSDAADAPGAPPAAGPRAVGRGGGDAGADPRPARADGGDRRGAHRSDLARSRPSSSRCPSSRCCAAG